MLGLILLVSALVGQDKPPADADRARRDLVRAIYVDDAAGDAIHRGATRKEKVELRREPAYLWTNPTREGGQDGAVFVYHLLTDRTIPAVEEPVPAKEGKPKP